MSRRKKQNENHSIIMINIYSNLFFTLKCPTVVFCHCLKPLSKPVLLAVGIERIQILLCGICYDPDRCHALLFTKIGSGERLLPSGPFRRFLSNCCYLLAGYTPYCEVLGVPIFVNIEIKAIWHRSFITQTPQMIRISAISSVNSLRNTLAVKR